MIGPGREPCRNRPIAGRDHERRHRQRQAGQAGLDRAQAEHRLQPDRGVGERGERGEGQQQRGDSTPTKARLRSSERSSIGVVACAARSTTNSGEQHRPRRPAAPRCRRRPSRARWPGSGRRSAQPRRAVKVDDAGQVDARAARGSCASSSTREHSAIASTLTGRLTKKIQRQRDALGEQAADDRADRGRRAGDRAPDAVRGAAVAAGVGAVQQRERGREHRGRADALHGAGGDQRAGVRREPAGRARTPRTAPARRCRPGGGRRGRRASRCPAAARRARGRRRRRPTAASRTRSPGRSPCRAARRSRS